MAFNFLQRAAVKMNDGNLTKALVVVGTGMIIYGTYKLVRHIDKAQAENAGRPDFEDLSDHPKVDIPEPTEEEKIEERKKERIEVVKHVGWIFGGVVLNQLCSRIRSWGYFTMRRMFHKEIEKFYMFQHGISKSLDDLSYWSSVAGTGEAAGMKKAMDCVVENLRKEGFRRNIR